MKKLILLLLLISLFTKNGFAQNLYFPPVSGTAWDTMSPSALGWCPETIDSLYTFLEDNNSKAFIVLKDGKMVLEKYFGTHSRDSLWYWASAGKTLTAFTVGIAQQEGFLNISDTSSNYLGAGWTACPLNKEEKITIRNQLSMTSGLNDGVPDHFCTLDTCLQYLADAGTRWAYHNGPYTLLDGVIAAATGQNLNLYFASKVRNQIGMNGAFYPSGYNNVYISNARSMARFGLLMLNRGNWNGTEIMTDTAYFNQMINTSQNLNQSYGYLWWLNGKSSFMVPTLQTVFPGMLMPDAPADTYAALGKNGQIINVVPSQNLVLIRMGDAPGTSSEVTISFNNDIWKRLGVYCLGTSTESYPANDIKIYPNPARDILFIESQKDIQKIKIINISGQVLYESNALYNTDFSIALTGFPKGFMFVELYGSFGKIVRKVFIEN